MLIVNQIVEFESNYKKYIDIVKYWDKQLMKQVNHDEWMAIFKRVLVF